MGPLWGFAATASGGGSGGFVTRRAFTLLRFAGFLRVAGAISDASLRQAGATLPQALARRQSGRPYAPCKA